MICIPSDKGTLKTGVALLVFVYGVLFLFFSMNHLSIFLQRV
jgi:hypothetical protein